MSLPKPPETEEQKAKRAVMNQEIFENLRALLAKDPSINLDFELGQIHLDAKKKYFPNPMAELLRQRRKPPTPKPKRFVAALLRSPAKFVVLRPLSDAAKMLIFGLSAGWETSEEDKSSDSDGADRFQQGIRDVLRCGEVVAELLGRGGVMRCRGSDGVDLAIKSVPSSTKAPDTEYATLEYLAEHAPDFPAPKPHGLLEIGASRLLIMTYIPSQTLKSVWPTLSHDNKLAIQGQLDRLFTRLRTLTQQGGRLGSVGGEGVSDSHAWVDHSDSDTVITTATEFRDFQFSIKALCGPEYAAFLKSLLPPPPQDRLAVFTHGDLFAGNIMVDHDPTRPGTYVVSGIIDWEESGFYPPWFEASKVLYTFREDGRLDMQDWWRYVPDCVAPARYPTEWAVGRLWDRANGVNAY